MSPQPPRPHTALLKSAEKIRDLEAQVQAYENLIEYIATVVQVPRAAAGRTEMLDHQRDLAIDLSVWLSGHRAFGPVRLLELLQSNLPEHGYPVEQP